MKLEEIRNKIDAIDDQIADLYVARMGLVKDVIKAKEESAISVSDPDRERKILLRVTENVNDEMQVYLKRVFETLFDTSKAYQTKNANYKSNLQEDIKRALEKESLSFPKRARVACQGVAGAYSGIAADRLFEIADVSYFKNFEGVFSAVEKGFCKFGVLPIENSSAGSVNEVYDLIKKHKFYIVKSIKLPVTHNLIAKKSVDMSSVKEIFSHQQAIEQCKGFLANLKDVKITACANTAVAAKQVAESDRNDIAAISSRECVDIYDLKILQSGIQDSNDNYTRFILIAKDMDFYKGVKGNDAGKISIMTTLQHTPGSLNKLLSKFYNLGINLTKLESRPIAGSSFEFMFYFDFECDIREKGVINLLSELSNSAEQFTFLGAYCEI